jgi:uncharacterized membrane protein YcaP (DUF421 family)
MSTILRAIWAYWFLLAVLRLIGRRAVMQSSPFELILIFLFGGTMIQAVVGDDRSLVNASLAVFTIGLMHVCVAWLKQRSTLFRKLTDGTAVVLRDAGTWHDDRMQRMRLQIEDVMAAARQKGVLREEDVESAIFKRSGQICVIPRENK